MNLGDLMIEYILFAFTDEQLMENFQVYEGDLNTLSDIDLLEIYDKTLLSPIEE
jgi:hypothetical protein